MEGDTVGWLRDLMPTAAPPYRSFGELARAARNSTDWPKDLAIQPRSLATILSKLDRGEQLPWLADRPAVQGVLSRLLSAPLSAVQRPLLRSSPAASTTDARLLRLSDLPGARPLDLVREPLPPGVPERITRPGGGAVWWVAPSGAGRSLCGQWLEARGRAAFVRASDGRRSPLPDGPVFLEFEREGGGARVAPREGLCVAAPAPPQIPGFEVVHSPPAEAFLEPLAAWAVARLPSDTRLVPSLAVPALVEKARARALVTLGDALGWLGLMDELGARELTKPLERICRRFVERRVGAKLDPASAHAPWIRRSIFALLSGLSERVLTDSELPLAAPRTFEEWMALVPPEVERAVDVEWMRLSLARLETPIRPSDLDRAARQLPPGAFRVVSTLEEAGLLVRGADETLRLQPAWLRRVLEQHATAALLDRSPFEWGEGVLRAHAAPPIAEALLHRTRVAGASALESVLELDAEQQPAYAAAVDVAFRVAAIARLQGADVSAEVLEGLLAESARLSVTVDGELPGPRIELSSGGASARRSVSDGEALLDIGSYYLAVLSATEVTGRRFARFSALDPWRVTTPSRRLPEVYDLLLASIESAPSWRDATFSLIARIRTVIGNVSDPETPHPLERPAQVIDEVVHGVLSWSALADERSQRGSIDGLWALARERQVPISTLATAIWTAWDEAGRPETAHFLAPHAPESALFWRNIPGTLLEHLLADVRRSHVPYAAFGPEQWRAYARALERNPELVNDSAAWTHVPPELVQRLLAQPLPWDQAQASLRVLWERFPAELQSEVLRHLAMATTASAGALSSLLLSAPSERVPDLLSALEEDTRPSLAPSAVPPLRQFLHRLVAERSIEWRKAYAALDELERELRRVAGADE